MSNFVILCSARTGSTLLVELLNLSPDIRCHYELLNPQLRQFGLEGAEARDPELEARLEALRGSDVQGFMAEIRARAPQPHFGLKIFKGHNDRFEEEVLRDRSWKKIVLYRSNLLAVYSSLLISQATGKWSQGGGAAQVVGGSSDEGVWNEQVHFDVEDFEKFAKRFQAPYRKWMSALAASRQDFHFIDYTQIRSQSMIGALTAFIGAAPPAELRARQVKTSTSVVVDRFENQIEVREYLKKVGRLDWQAESFLDL